MTRTWLYPEIRTCVDTPWWMVRGIVAAFPCANMCDRNDVVLLFSLHIFRCEAPISHIFRPGIQRSTMIDACPIVGNRNLSEVAPNRLCA